MKAVPYPEGSFGTDDWVDIKRLEGQIWVRLPAKYEPNIPYFGFAIPLLASLSPWPKDGTLDGFLSKLNPSQKRHIAQRMNMSRSKALA